MTRNLALSVTLISNLFARLLFAATIHVPADQPTIQAGINAAGNGDTVLVAPCTYKENINFHGKAVRVKSSGGAKVTITDGGGVAPVVTFSSNETSSSVLSGFTLQNGTSTFNSQYEGDGIYVSFESGREHHEQSGKADERSKQDSEHLFILSSDGLFRGRLW